jgi:hypothetical protein
MTRYAAKLLFQFRRSDEPADGGHRRIVERRIVAIDASGPEEAYERALALGAEEEWSGNYGDFDVNFELVGILQMIERTAGDDSELWWELDELDAPLERAAELVPPKRDLIIFDGPRDSRRLTLFTERK